MKTTCVLLVLATLIAFAVCARHPCHTASDCHCAHGQKAHCGIALFSDILHGHEHLDHTCHCEAPLSHCSGSCHSLTCGTHLLLDFPIQQQKICADGHCTCILVKPHIPG